MKWFKHYSNSHKNLKFQRLINKFGWQGYAFWWVLVELIAEQGDNYVLKSEKNWKNYVKTCLKIDEKNLKMLLNCLKKSGLIDPEALSDGIISIPQLKEYCDDYSNKLRRVSEQSPPQEKRREEKRKEEKRDSEHNFLNKTGDNSSSKRTKDRFIEGSGWLKDKLKWPK